MQVAFYQSESEQPHPGRARAIIKAHPEVRQLMVRNPWTALIAASVVVMQTGIAFHRILRRRGTGVAVDKILALTGQTPTVQIANLIMPTEAEREERRAIHNRLDAIAHRLADTRCE